MTGWAIALVLGAPGSRQEDTDQVFFNAPRHPRGIATVDPAEATGRAVVTVDLARCAPTDLRVLVALRNGSRPLHRDAPVRVAIDSAGTRLATSELAPVGTESAMVLLELYRRDGSWKVRAVRQGYDGGLDALVTDYGFQVEPVLAVPEPLNVAAPAPLLSGPVRFALWGTRGT